MKKCSISLIVIIFLIFCSYLILQNNTYTVLKVFSINKVGVDFNKNGALEDNEKIVLENIENLTSKMSNITEEEFLELNYLSEQFAKNLLENKQIKFKNNQIYVDKQNYTEIVSNSAFAIKNNKPKNQNLFSKELQKIHKNPLKIYNNKSNKYHYLTCEYGQKAHDSVILNKSQLPKDALECKFCRNQHSSKHESNQQVRAIKRLILSSGAIKLFLTDFTTKLKPDKKCSTDLCKTFLDQVNSSRNSIDIAIYGYDDVPIITKALQNAISRGVKVRMVYNYAENNYYKDTDFLVKLISASKSDYGTKPSNYAIMHNKFYIFDNERVMTGSANLSPTGMSGFNSNAVLFINSKEVARAFTTEFEQMYNGRFHNLKQNYSNNDIKLNNSLVKVRFSPKNTVITTEILPMVNNAKKYVYVPAFLITSDKFAQSLIRAKNRGVSVKIIIDATGAYQNRSKFKELRQNGIDVKVENYAGKMHSKSIIIDDKYLVIGSMNFSNSGENKNDENIVIIENAELAKFYKVFFEYVWSKILEKYLKITPRAEGIDSIGSCSDGVDNDFDGKIDLKDEGCFPLKNK